MNNTNNAAITAMKVERDGDGHWTHPAYIALFGDREQIDGPVCVWLRSVSDGE